MAMGLELRFVTESRLADGEIKGRFTDVNNRIRLIHVCKNLMTHTQVQVKHDSVRSMCDYQPRDVWYYVLS